MSQNTAQPSRSSSDSCQGIPEDVGTLCKSQVSDKSNKNYFEMPQLSLQIISNRFLNKPEANENLQLGITLVSKSLKAYY